MCVGERTRLPTVCDGSEPALYRCLFITAATTFNRTSFVCVCVCVCLSVAASNGSDRMEFERDECSYNEKKTTKDIDWFIPLCHNI